MLMPSPWRRKSTSLLRLGGRKSCSVLTLNEVKINVP
jgi:hypothetical protein